MEEPLCASSGRQWRGHKKDKGYNVTHKTTREGQGTKSEDSVVYAEERRVDRISGQGYDGEGK
jgi:hypothetical protein